MGVIQNRDSGKQSLPSKKDSARCLIAYPTYPSMTQTDIDTFGFPAGYFILRSVGSNRLLDVTLDDIEDGTEIALWPEKEKSLVESMSKMLSSSGLCL